MNYRTQIEIKLLILRQRVRDAVLATKKCSVVDLDFYVKLQVRYETINWMIVECRSKGYAFKRRERG